jgi:hypothetical protein
MSTSQVEVLPALNGNSSINQSVTGYPRRVYKLKDPMRAIDPVKRCKAMSKQRHEPCKRIAIPGGHVCVFHGGKSPQVKHAAKERLNALVDPAITELTRLMNESDLDPVRLAVAKDILDRTGFKPKERVEVTDVNRRLESLAAGRARAQKMLESE